MTSRVALSGSLAVTLAIGVPQAARAEAGATFAPAGTLPTAAEKAVASASGSRPAPSSHPAVRTARGIEPGAAAQATRPVGRKGARRTGSIAGQVVNERGARFAGALVRILETGETATADKQGLFRFDGLEPGQYTLKVSVLGLRPITRAIAIESGLTSKVRFTMWQPLGEDGSIVIYGSRSARANALNIQRTAENSADVISADDLGKFTGTSLSDVLRRAPGISFQRDPLTGDGTNVIIRGLEPDMNAVKLNGLNLPVGNGTGRSPDLSNLLADTVGRIVINKTLLPSQDSAGTGGLIEVETLSPLDRPRRFGSIQVEGGSSGRAFAHDFLMSGVLSGRFGAGENFGLSASLQYRENEARNISYTTDLDFGASLPLDAQGQPTLHSLDDVNPLLTFPFSPGVDQAYPDRLETRFNEVHQSTLAAVLSAEWRLGGHTSLRFDAVHSETRRTTFTLGDAFTALIHYADRPGDPALAELQLDLTRGNKALRREQDYVYDRGARITTDTYSINGKTAAGRLTFNYLLGYARGTERHPDHFALELRMPDSDARSEYFLPQATDATAGFIISPFGPRTGKGVPLPLFTEAGWAFVNDPSKFVVTDASGELDQRHGSNNRSTASLSGRYDVDRGPLSYLEAGVYYERAGFRSGLARSQLGGNVPVSALGLAFSPSDLRRIGLDVPGFEVISDQAIAGFAGRLDQLTATTALTLTPIVPQPGEDKESTSEETIAAYLQGRIAIGKLEVIGGARLNRTRLEATNLTFPTYIGPILPEDGGGFGIDLAFQNAFTRLVSQKATGTDILPRILFNYRQSDKLIFRGAYYLSVARPQIGQLSRETRITFINIPIPGPQGVKPILQISTGNPDLKPATTQNFDVSVEHYSDQIGVMRLSGFYKHIRNLLQTNVTNGNVNLGSLVLPNHPYFHGPPFFDPANPGAYFIMGQSPANSPHPAWIWGIEAQLERKFSFLPGIWNGFGIYANYTFTKSSRVERFSWGAAPGGEKTFEFLSVPFAQQPRHSGTVALTFNKLGIDANLAYGFQSRALALFQPRGLSAYNEGDRTLDLRVEYNFQRRFGRIRIYFEGSDLLKGTSSPDVLQTLGGTGKTPRFYTDATYLGGRRFKLGLSLGL